MIPLFSDHLMEQIEGVKSLILSEVNVKTLEYITDTAGILVKKVKPDFKILGPRYGKLMKPLAEVLVALSQPEISELEREGKLMVSVSGQPVEVSAADIEILSEDIPGWQIASMGTLTVALDITITPELWQEGIAREVINRIQNLRKDNGFEVTDKILVKFESVPEIDDALNCNISYICSETLAQSFDVVDTIEDTEKVSIELTDMISTFVLIRKVD